MNGENLMDKDPFKEYIKQTEPGKRDKGYAWHTAIGLQAVDGLKPSKYLIDTAIKNIEGDISIDEAQALLNAYYEENPKVDTGTVQKKQIRLLLGLQRFYRRRHLALRQMSISLFTKSCLQEFMDMPEN